MSTFLTARMPAPLVNELKALAKLPRAPTGYVPALAQEYGYAVSTLRNAVCDLRELRRKEQNGAAGVIPPARVCGPERARAISGHDAGGVMPAGIRLDVSSLKLDARGESRAVASAAGTVPPPPCDGVGVVPAAVFSAEEPALSPGLMWAWAMLERGVPRDKLLRTAGDRLTWRDRDQLMGRAA